MRKKCLIQICIYIFVVGTRYTIKYVRYIRKTTQSTDDGSVFFCTRMTEAWLIHTYGVRRGLDFSFFFSSGLARNVREQTDKYYRTIVRKRKGGPTKENEVLSLRSFYFFRKMHLQFDCKNKMTFEYNANFYCKQCVDKKNENAICYQFQNWLFLLNIRT